VGLGDIYNREARPEKAAEMYRQAVRLDPELDIARYRLGMTYLSMNAVERAREQLEVYLQISPQGVHAQEVSRILEQMKERAPSP
jgi:Tfp pilus assembly protein PilF